MYRAILLLTLISLVTATSDFASRLFSLPLFAQNQGTHLHSFQASAEAKVEILSPTNGDTFIIEYDTIYFQGGVTGYAGDIQSLVWQWESSVDGSLGSGSELEMASSALSLASHVITLQVRDGEGVVGEAQINITISARYPPPPPTCMGEANVAISSPQTGSRYAQGSEVLFRGEVTGFAGDVDSLDWQWRIGGEVPIGNQREFTRSDLPLGHYIISLWVDVPGDCRIGTGEISISVEKALYLPLIMGTSPAPNE